MVHSGSPVWGFVAPCWANLFRFSSHFAWIHAPSLGTRVISPPMKPH